MIMQKIAFIYILLCYVGGTLSVSAQQRPHGCTAYTVDKNTVTFACAEGSKLQLQFSSSSVVRVWFDPKGELQRSNPSFAVVQDQLEDVGEIQVNDEPASFEIYTAKLRVRLNKHPMQLLIYDKWQKLIFGDYKDQGLVVDGTRITAH